jgi:hypothetical protein
VRGESIGILKFVHIEVFYVPTQPSEGYSKPGPPTSGAM